MIAWGQFLPQVQPHVFDCPQPVVIDAIRLAAIEFCEETWIWQATHQYTLSPGSVETDFDPEEDGMVYKPLSCEFADGSRQLHARTPDWLTARFPGWRIGLHPGTPEHYTQISSSQFMVVPAPESSVSVVMDLVIKPTRNAARCYDDLYHDYLEVIAAGAKARLMAMADKPWSNLQLGAALLTGFNQEVKIARHRVQKGRGRGRIRTEAQFL
jgi:hypothetical protein